MCHDSSEVEQHTSRLRLHLAEIGSRSRSQQQLKKPGFAPGAVGPALAVVVSQTHVATIFGPPDVVVLIEVAVRYAFRSASEQHHLTVRTSVPEDSSVVLLSVLFQI